MKPVVLALAALLATPALVSAAPKPPTSPYPSCTGDVTFAPTVTSRVGGKAAAGSIRFGVPILCDHDQLSMSLRLRLLKDGRAIATTPTVSCSFQAPDLTCASLTTAGKAKVSRAMAGRYEVEVTLMTQGIDYVVPSVQSHVGFWSDPCTKDSTWTTVTCTTTERFTVS